VRNALDEQIQKKNLLKQQLKQQQQDYSLKMNKEVLSYAEEQQKKKRDTIERNQKH
jgi:hypothetical protein